MLKVKIFYYWEISFVGPLLMSNNHEYILVVVDYVSKWVEATVAQKAD